jgi:hypothetical protein
LEDTSVYRQLTSQERDILFRAFGRFASTKQSLPELEAAAQEYQRVLHEAGIVFTPQGFVLVAEDVESTPMAVSTPR